MNPLAIVATAIGFALLLILFILLIKQLGGSSGKPVRRAPHEAMGKGMGIGIAIGMGAGVAIGTALGNVALGIAIGAGIGVALGAAFGKSFQEKEQKNNRTAPVKETDASGRRNLVIIAILALVAGLVIAGILFFGMK